MKLMKKILTNWAFAGALLIMISASAMAYVVAYDTTDNGGDARLLGIGRAYTAISDDPNAVFINPSGLGTIKNVQATGMFYTKMFGTYSVFTGAGALATPYGSFAVGYVGQGTGNMNDTRDPSDIKTFGYTDNVFIASYGTSLRYFDRSWSRVFVGLSAKFYNRGYSQSVGDSATAFNIDLGMKYIPTEWLSLGLAKSNAIPPYMGGGLRWTSGNYEVLDSPTRIGVALKGFEGKAEMGLDAIIPSKGEEPTLFSLGGEYSIDSHFTVRAGFAENIDAEKATRTTFDPSLGLGFKYDFMKVDYAYVPYFSDSGNATHYISISFIDILDTLLKIKIGKVEDEDVDLKKSMLDNYPGPVFDDQGRVVKGVSNPYLQSISVRSEMEATSGALIPAAAETVDYGRLYAYAFTDLKTAREDQDTKKYGAGDIVPVIVEAPFDTATVTAEMPNGDVVNLSYDEKAMAWYGIWRVPEGLSPGSYRAKATSKDFDGNGLTAYSSMFVVGGAAASKSITPETSADINIIDTPEAGIGGPATEETVGITVVSPLDKTVSYSYSTDVMGTCGGEMRTIYINGDPVMPGTDGVFLGNVPLSLGKNLITVKGAASSGAMARVDRRVLRIAVSPAATPKEIEMIKSLPIKQQLLITIASDSVGKVLGPFANLKRAEAAVVFADLKGLQKDPVLAKPFKDVAPDYWAAESIGACKKANYFVGYPDGNFKPEKNITLAEFCTVTLRCEGIVFPKTVPGKKHWAAGVMDKVAELKLLTGADKKSISDLNKGIVISDCTEILSKTGMGGRKADDLLDWSKGY